MSLIANLDTQRTHYILQTYIYIDSKYIANGCEIYSNEALIKEF